MSVSRSVVPAFDIFRLDSTRQPVWQESAESMVDATMRVRLLGASLPGEYLIHSHKTGIEISISVKQPENKHRWFKFLPKTFAVQL
jgi:hypothetical protein